MIVADTNLVVPLLVEHPQRENALRLFAQDPDWHLPDWWRIELSNVLRNYHRADLFTLEEVTEILLRSENLFSLQSTHSVDLPTSLRIACANRISTYDACFIALARSLRAKLVTEDARLRTACPDDTLSLDQALAQFP